MIRRARDLSASADSSSYHRRINLNQIAPKSSAAAEKIRERSRMSAAGAERGRARRGEYLDAVSAMSLARVRHLLDVPHIKRERDFPPYYVLARDIADIVAN
jgi:hypothetical protein